MLQRAALPLLCLLAAAGCGGDGGGGGPADRSASTPTATPTASATPKPAPLTGRVTGTFTAAQVVEHFERETGVTLKQDPSFKTPYLQSPTSARERFGLFSVQVRDPDDDPPDGVLEPVTDVYWEERPEYDYVSGSRRYGNVELGWTADEPVVSPEIRRVDAVLATLPSTADAIEDELPDEERPCRKQGISVTGGPEGTCRNGTQSLTFADQGSTLRVPGLDLRIEAAVRARAVKEQAGIVSDADGVWVALLATARNRTDDTINPWLGPLLRMADGDAYDIDGITTIVRRGSREVPAGRSSTRWMVFELPADARLRGAALVVPEPDAFGVEDAERLGVVRLGSLPGPQPRRQLDVRRLKP